MVTDFILKNRLAQPKSMDVRAYSPVTMFKNTLKNANQGWFYYIGEIANCLGRKNLKDRKIWVKFISLAVKFFGTVFFLGVSKFKTQEISGTIRHLKKC